STIRSSYGLATWVFLRLLGVSYLAAFGSLALQIVPLVGHDGILPAHDYMAAASAWASGQQIGLDRYWLLPTVCWFAQSAGFLIALCLIGVLLSLLLIAGLAPFASMALLWIDYLSLSVVGREFLSYQWDALLLETGLVAICAAPMTWTSAPRHIADPPRIAR